MTKLPSVSELRKRFNYSEETGFLYWKPLKDNPQWTAKFAGKVAGCIRTDGYVTVGFNNKCYLAHRIIWAIVKGKWAKQLLDHIDGDRGNNLISNLREVDYVGNSQNARKRLSNTSGVCSVSWHAKAKKWSAEFTTKGKKHSLGLFVNLTDAETVVKRYRQIYGFGERHGI